MRVIVWLLLAAAILPAQELLDGPELKQWESRGDGIWMLRSDGVLVGQRRIARNPPKPDQPGYRAWLNQQAWIYTKREYESFDLTLEYWLPVGGNSGISLRDPSRAQFAIATPPDFTRTPSKLGYEIQLNNQYPDQYASGSIYGFQGAPAGLQNEFDWNQMRIESRPTGIRVFINGKPAAEHAGDPKRAVRGPVGLQLHDQKSLVMFRNIRIVER